MEKTNYRTRYGVMHYLENDVYIGRAYDLYGEANELEVAFLCSLVTRNDVVIDIGANIGTHTVPLAGYAKAVHAFEAQAEIYDLLARNCETAVFSSDENVPVAITTHNVALGKAGIPFLYVPKLDYTRDNNFGGVSLMATEISGSSHAVPLKTLDSYSFSDVRLIKIDVEGMEQQVLEGAKETITRNRPLLYVENDRAAKSAALIDYIQKLGYVLYWHTPPLFNPHNFKENPENVFANIVAINMLCVPTEQTIPQTKGLRRVSGPQDTAFGAVTSKVRPSNGWAAVVRFGGIGDNLMAASAVGALKRKGLKVEVITAMDCAWQVFEHNPNIDKLSLKTKSEFSPDMLTWQKWFKGRADEYDVFAHLSHSCEGLLALFPASTQFYWPAHFRRKICNRNYLETVHDIAGVGYDFGPLFYASEAEKVQALQTKEKVGKRCIAWCLSGTRIDKMHPYTPGIIARIIKELGAPVVMLGRPGKNFEDAERIRDHVVRTNGSHDGLHIAISASPDEQGNRDWPIRRTIAFAQACDLVVGPDTGVMWGVAFEQVPKIMLLSHASPENITKHWLNTTTLTADPHRVPCWPCHQLHDEPSTCTPNAENSGAACITDISTEVILSNVGRLWNV